MNRPCACTRPRSPVGGSRIAAATKPAPSSAVCRLALDEARRHGAEHALAVASWTVLSESDAVTVLEDVDPAVLDLLPWPNLSGEWADDPTPLGLLRDLGYEPRRVPDEGWNDLCDAWQDEADEVFSQALDAIALRLIGRVDDALVIERTLERRASVR